MSHVYILESEKNNKYYIGSCEIVETRLQQHNAGQVRSTKSGRPWKLILTQEYPTNQIARRIELKLKKLKRKDYITHIIKDGYIKMGL